ncbi:unnamed protein product, partial [Chrysoparadoxa australica]
MKAEMQLVLTPLPAYVPKKAALILGLPWSPKDELLARTIEKKKKQDALEQNEAQSPLTPVEQEEGRREAEQVEVKTEPAALGSQGKKGQHIAGSDTGERAPFDTVAGAVAASIGAQESHDESELGPTAAGTAPVERKADNLEEALPNPQVDEGEIESLSAPEPSAIDKQELLLAASAPMVEQSQPEAVVPEVIVDLPEVPPKAPVQMQLPEVQDEVEAEVEAKAQKLLDVKEQISDVKEQVSDVKEQVSDVKEQVSDVKEQL